MKSLNGSAQAVRFGVFEVDRRTGELRKQGLKIKLQDKPFQLLTLLLDRPGEVVTREELREKLWPGDTFVDFDHSMNTAVNKLREALGDSADNPRFVETLPRRGYRLIAPVEEVGRSGVPASPEVFAPPVTRRRTRLIVLGALALVAFVAAGLYMGRDRLWPRANPPEGRIMLAVLPFHNLSGDPEQEYFSDGLTEEMISQLGRMQPEHLAVIARTSAMHYKNTDKRVDEIGRELGVDYILEGSVRRERDRVAITAQLIQVRDQSQVWGESYERELGQVLGLQKEVARAVAHEIRLKLTPQQQERLASARPVNPRAYEAYLRGRYHWSKRSDEGLRKAIQSFEQAIAEDPNYAPAYSGLADSYFSSGFWGLLPSKEAWPKATVAAQKAVELDDTLAEAHASLALAYLVDGDSEGAEREYQRALHLNPGYAQGRMWYGDLLSGTGQPQAAVEQMRVALQSDPLSLMVNNATGWHLYLARQFDAAIQQFKKTLELDPNFALAHYDLGRAYEGKGMYAEALAAFEKARALSPDTPYILAGLGHCYAVSGKQREARRLLAQLHALSKHRYVKPLDIAFIHIGLDEKDQALQWLDKAYEERAGWLGYLPVDPVYDPLRSDPRFQELLRRIQSPRP